MICPHCTNIHDPRPCAREGATCDCCAAMFPTASHRANACAKLEASEHADDVWIGESYPASEAAAQVIMSMPVDVAGYGHGRSGWRWLRLSNGDLMLGVFPHGDTYFEVEEAVEQDWTTAHNANQSIHMYLTPSEVEDQGFGIAKIVANR